MVIYTYYETYGESSTTTKFTTSEIGVGDYEHGAVIAFDSGRIVAGRRGRAATVEFNTMDKAILYAFGR